MRYGIREVCDMEFNKLSGVGPANFSITSAKTSTLESASTTVYAQGGKGNSRLMAWEGEKTLTFTVEDALITMESFYALTGASVNDTADGIKFTAKTTSFAGFYFITATTLFRDELGNDHPAIITIPRAKLQSNLNIAMAPSGDPSAFTFTFDAFPGTEEATKDVLFTLEIKDKDGVNLDLPSETLTRATVYLQGNAYTVVKEAGDSGFAPVVDIGADGNLTLKKKSGATTGNVAITVNYETGDTGLTDLNDYYAKGTAKTIEMTTSTLNLYVI